MAPERINPRYRDALLEARTRAFALVRAGEQQLLATYADIIARLGEDLATGTITAERAARLRNEVMRAMVGFETRMVELSDQARRVTAREIERIHRDAVRGLFREAGLTPPDMDRIATRALAAMAARGESAAAFETVARRKLQAIAGEIDTFLQAAVARGVEAGRGSIDLARLLAGDNPRLVSLVNRAGANPRLVRELQVGAGVIDYEAYGIRPGQVQEIRTLFYDARRIQVSETNNAFREANAEALRESPIVTAVKWEVSGRHDFGDPDECSVLATADYYGFGPGMYPPEKFPLAPHPHCQCSQQGPIRFRPPNEWNRPKPAPPGLGIRPDDPSVTRRFEGQWTENRKERVDAILRGTLGEAERQHRERMRAAS